MGHELHIERQQALSDDDRDITLEEWRAAVAQTEGVRMAEGDWSVTTSSGTKLTIANRGGNAEVFHPAEGEWRRAFRWSQGVISLPARDFLFVDGPLRTATNKLALLLRAVVRGEEGEPFVRPDHPYSSSDEVAGNTLKLETLFCFRADSLSGPELARIVANGVGFEPTRIQTDDFLMRRGRFKKEEHLKRITATPGIRRVRLETEHGMNGPHFDVITLQWSNSQTVYWEVPGFAPALDFLHSLTGLNGFSAGYTASADDVFWQSTDEINTYEAFGRPHQDLPRANDKIDISLNPGRRCLIDGMWLQSSWRMWFGKGAFDYFSRDKLLGYQDADCVVSLPSGGIFIQLYAEAQDCDQPQNRARQKAFRDWVGMDRLEDQALF